MHTYLRLRESEPNKHNRASVSMQDSLSARWKINTVISINKVSTKAKQAGQSPIKVKHQGNLDFLTGKIQVFSFIQF